MHPGSYRGREQRSFPPRYNERTPGLQQDFNGPRGNRIMGGQGHNDFGNNINRESRMSGNNFGNLRSRLQGNQQSCRGPVPLLNLRFPNAERYDQAISSDRQRRGERPDSVEFNNPRFVHNAYPSDCQRGHNALLETPAWRHVGNHGDRFKQNPQQSILDEPPAVHQHLDQLRQQKRQFSVNDRKSWDLIKPHLYSLLESHFSLKADKADALPPSGNFSPEKCSNQDRRNKFKGKFDSRRAGKRWNKSKKSKNSPMSKKSNFIANKRGENLQEKQHPTSTLSRPEANDDDKCENQTLISTNTICETTDVAKDTSNISNTNTSDMSTSAELPQQTIPSECKEPACTSSISKCRMDTELSGDKLSCDNNNVGEDFKTTGATSADLEIFGQQSSQVSIVTGNEQNTVNNTSVLEQTSQQEQAGSNSTVCMDKQLPEAGKSGSRGQLDVEHVQQSMQLISLDSDISTSQEYSEITDVLQVKDSQLDKETVTTLDKNKGQEAQSPKPVSPTMRDRKSCFGSAMSPQKDRQGKGREPPRPPEPGKTWSSNDYFTGGGYQTSGDQSSMLTSPVTPVKEQTKGPVEGGSDPTPRKEGQRITVIGEDVKVSKKFGTPEKEGKRIAVIGENTPQGARGKTRTPGHDRKRNSGYYGNRTTPGQMNHTVSMDNSQNTDVLYQRGWFTSPNRFSQNHPESSQYHGHDYSPRSRQDRDYYSSQRMDRSISNYRADFWSDSRHRETFHGHYHPSRDVDTYSSRDIGAYPSRYTDTFPSRDIDTYPGRDIDRYPGRNIDAYPSRDIDAYPSRDTDKNPNRDIDRYPGKNIDAYPNSNRDIDYREGHVKEPAYRAENRDNFSWGRSENSNRFNSSQFNRQDSSNNNLTQTLQRGEDASAKDVSADRDSGSYFSSGNQTSCRGNDKERKVSDMYGERKNWQNDERMGKPLEEKQVSPSSVRKNQWESSDKVQEKMEHETKTKQTPERNKHETTQQFRTIDNDVPIEPSLKQERTNQGSLVENSRTTQFKPVETPERQQFARKHQQPGSNPASGENRSVIVSESEKLSSANKQFYKSGLLETTSSPRHHTSDQGQKSATHTPRAGSLDREGDARSLKRQYSGFESSGHTRNSSGGNQKGTDKNTKAEHGANRKSDKSNDQNDRNKEMGRGTDKYSYDRGSDRSRHSSGGSHSSDRSRSTGAWSSSDDVDREGKIKDKRYSVERNSNMQTPDKRDSQNRRKHSRESSEHNQDSVSTIHSGHSHRHRHKSKGDDSSSTPHRHKHRSKGSNSTRPHVDKSREFSRQDSKKMGSRSGSFGNTYSGHDLKKEDRRYEKTKIAETGTGAKESTTAGSDLDIDEDDSDDELEAPFFLTSLTEASSRPIPSTPTKGINVSSTDSPAPSTSPQVTLDPMPSQTSAFSLDVLLAEAIDKTSEERQCEDMHAELEEGLRKGGFVKDTLEEADDGTLDEELLREHQMKLQRFQVCKSQMNELHPGETIFVHQHYQRLFNSSVTAQACGFVPGTTYIDKHLNTVQPADYLTLLTSDLLLMCFDAVSCQDAVLRWLLFIMSVHPSHLVINGCYKTIEEHLYSCQHFSCKTKHTWSPSVLDILSILYNYGADPSHLLPKSVVPDTESLRQPLFQQHDIDNQVPGNRRYNRENFRLVLSILAMAFQVRPKYNCNQLTQMIVMLCKAALDKSLNNNMLTHEFKVVVASLLKLYPETEWTTQSLTVCRELSCLTLHHHNRVYLAQLLPPTTRGNFLQRRVSYLMIHKHFFPDKNVSDDMIINFELKQTHSVLPMLQGLAHTDIYLMASCINLLDLCVGSGLIKSAEKDDLNHLTEEMNRLTGEVRDNVQMLDMTRVKDMMIRVTSKWTLILLSIGSKQRTLFEYSERIHKSPAMVKIETVDASQSDHASESSEEEDEEEETSMSEDETKDVTTIQNRNVVNVQNNLESADSDVVGTELSMDIDEDDLPEL